MSGTLVVAVTAGAALLLSGTADADTPNLGTLTVTPATGTDISSVSSQTSGACPSTASAADLRIVGPIGAASPTFLPSSPYQITPSSSSQFSTTGPFTQQFGLSLKEAAADSTNASTNKTLQPGEYDLTSECLSRAGSTVATFSGKMFLTSGSTVPTASFSYTTTAATTTTLTTTPVGSASPGTSVTLNAAVTPSAAGTVQFMDGTTNIGTPVPVAANGTASTTTSTLTTASHQLTAVFTPTDTTAFNPSTSAAVTFTVGVAPSTATTTTLTTSPVSPVAPGATVTLNAAVTPTTAAGTVQFTDGTTNIGSPVAVTSGAASTTTSTLASGSHSLVANFIPTDATAFAASSSQVVSLTVSGTGGAGSSGASETITTTIAAGSLVISVANTNVTLPPPTLSTDGTLLTTAGKINPVTVTDTRAANPGWSVSGQVADFSDAASHAINGGNLGWVPNVIDKGAGQTVTAGTTVAPANGIAPGTTPPAGNGLSTSRTLATAAALAGIGTAHLDALLNLNAPTSTPAGTYTAVLTLTAI
jgi:Big-like domain-containing protein